MIETTLKKMTARERANAKGQEIANVPFRGRFDMYGVKIEIVDIEKIEGGVSVFARAWKNKRQLGFGKDGSVDVERFRIFNPPVLVDDPKGNIIRRWRETKDSKVIQKIRTLREDPEQAIKEVIAHNITLVGKEGTKIIKGKIGNTVSTFYPSAGAVSPVDGRVGSDDAGGAGGEDWSVLRGNAGNSSDDVGATFTMRLRGGTTANKWRRMDRGIVGFDTSTIGTDAIDSAILSLYGTGAGSSTYSLSVAIDKTVPASASALVNGDFDRTDWDGVRQNNTDIAFTAWAIAYNDFTLNATGEGNINKTGNTFFGVTTDADLDDAEPTYSNAEIQVDAQSADTTGTSQDPKLVVTHSAVAVANAGFAGFLF